MIAQDIDVDNPHGLCNAWQLVVIRVRMQGFLTYDHAGVLPRAQDGWYADGVLRPLDNLRTSFGRLPEAFIAPMHSRTIGKTMVEAA